MLCERMKYVYLSSMSPCTVNVNAFKLTRAKGIVVLYPPPYVDFYKLTSLKTQEFIYLFKFCLRDCMSERIH